MLKKAIHNIQHCRPQWYKDYHDWQYHGVLHWATFIVSSVVILMGFVSVLTQLTQNVGVKIASADDDTTVVSQQITGGALSISNSGAESMGSAALAGSFQDTTGDLGTITVTDNRGTGEGWSATVQSTNFYKYNNPVTASGVNSITLGVSTPFATSSGGFYTITIVNPGAPGTATFDVDGPAYDPGSGVVQDDATGVATTGGTNIAVGANGLKVDFAGSYSAGDEWTIRVDTIPVERFMIDPGNETPLDGNVNPGSVNFFDLPTENVSLMSTPDDQGYGMGAFSMSPALKLGIPANSFANTYTATVTETVN